MKGKEVGKKSEKKKKQGHSLNSARITDGADSGALK